MGCYNEYQLYKEDQKIVEKFLFAGTTPTENVTERYIRAASTKYHSVPEDATKALDRVIETRIRVMKYYGHIRHHITFKRHMHIILLFKFVRLILKNDRASEEYKKLLKRFKKYIEKITASLDINVQDVVEDDPSKDEQSVDLTKDEDQQQIVKDNSPKDGDQQEIVEDSLPKDKQNVEDDSLKDEDYQVIFEQVQQIMFLEDLMNLVKLVSKNSTMAGQGECDFGTFGLSLNCIHEISTHILATEQLRNPRLFQEEGLFVDSATSKHELLREMHPIRQNIIQNSIPGLLKELSFPLKALPCSPARITMDQNIIDLAMKGEVIKDSALLFSVTLNALIFMKAQEGWSVSPHELSNARLNGLATSVSTFLVSAKGQLGRLYDCCVALNIKEEILIDLANQKRMYEDWDTELFEVCRKLDPWSSCHIIAAIFVDLQTLYSQMGRLLVLPAFFHLYLRQKIRGQVSAIALIDQYMNAYHPNLFWKGIPLDPPSLELSYERMVLRDSTAGKIIENRSTKMMEDISYSLAKRLVQNNYRLGNEIYRSLEEDVTSNNPPESVAISDPEPQPKNDDGSSIITKLNALESKLKIQAANSFNGVDIQFAIMLGVKTFCDEQFGERNYPASLLRSILSDPLNMETHLAVKYIKTVDLKLQTGQALTCKAPSFRAMPNIFTIHERVESSEKGVPAVLCGVDDAGVEAIVFPILDSNLDTLQIRAGSNSLHACLDMPYKRV